MQHDGNCPDEPPVDAQRQYWDARWETQRSPNNWQKRRAEAIVNLLRDLPLRRPAILDLGCATGWMTRMLSEIGPAEGVDLSEAAIAIARSKYPGIRFTAGDLYEIPLTSQPVDVVVCQEVVAHVSDQPALIRRIANVTRPDGYLIISAANKLVMDRLRDEDGVGVGPADPEAHIKRWLDRRSLKRLLKPHFHVIRTTSVIPLGHRGLLRVVNSAKLNEVAGWALPPGRLEALKARLGLGYTIIAVGRKKP